VAVAIVGDFDPSFEPHSITQSTLTQAGESLGVQIKFKWLPTESLGSTVEQLSAFNGLWIAPGSPYRSMQGALSAIRYAREHKVPLLGTCGGFQHVILEYARNVLGLRDARHAEYDPYASFLFISRLVCSLAGRSLLISLKRNSRVAEMYGKTNITEKYYCNFGLNPEYLDMLQSRDLRIVGSDAEGEARLVELRGHPFLVATLFVPNLPVDAPHPLVRAFVAMSMAAVTT
jgi:CTP synthase (UTP-ammonia lyase)